jgi:hypothetical protein
MVSSMVKLPASDLRFVDAVVAVGIGMVFHHFLLISVARRV